MDWAISNWMIRVSDEATDCEEQCLHRIAQGDRDALGELYERYRLILIRYFHQLTSDHGLAEEMLQDTLLAVWKSAHNFEGRSQPRTWLLGVARRQAHNTLRRRGVPAADLGDFEAVAEPRPGPEEILLAGGAGDELMRAMGYLTPIHREVLHLIFVQELSYLECSKVLGIPVGTVRSRVSNARRALRAQLRAERETE